MSHVAGELHTTATESLAHEQAPPDDTSSSSGHRRRARGTRRRTGRVDDRQLVLFPE